MINPACGFPPSQAEGGIQAHRYDDCSGGDLGPVEGTAFWDGSARPGVVKELDRAARSFKVYDPDTLLPRVLVSGPVHWTLPQTAPAASG